MEAVSFTSLPLYTRGNSSRYTWLGGCLGLRAGLDAVEHIKISSLPDIELRPSETSGVMATARHLPPSQTMGNEIMRAERNTRIRAKSNGF
jgi:hypothetical protein